MHTTEITETSLAQETSISKSSAAKAMELLKLWPYKATVVMLCNQMTRLAGLISVTGFYNQFMMVKLTLISLFPDEAWFHLHRHISFQNNLYWSLIHEVPLYDVISACLLCVLVQCYQRIL
jgi:hypothetical protein